MVLPGYGGSVLLQSVVINGSICSIWLVLPMAPVQLLAVSFYSNNCFAHYALAVLHLLGCGFELKLVEASVGSALLACHPRGRENAHL